jgi:hypothetical protein
LHLSCCEAQVSTTKQISQPIKPQIYAQICKDGRSGVGRDIFTLHLLTDAVEVLDYSAVNVQKRRNHREERVEKQHLGGNNDDIDNGDSRNG